MSHFIATLDLLRALQTECEALELSPGEKLFKQVRFYAGPDIVRALSELAVFESRACFLVPSADEFENTFSGRDLRTMATREIIMLLSDRHVGDTEKALEQLTTIKDIVVEELLGEQLGFSPRLVRLRPSAGQPVFLTTDEQKKQRGRWVWQITWLADVGHTSVSATI